MRNVKYIQNIKLFKNGEIVVTTTGRIDFVYPGPLRQKGIVMICVVCQSVCYGWPRFVIMPWHYCLFSITVPLWIRQWPLDILDFLTKGEWCGDFILFVVSLMKKKQLICPWFEMSWLSWCYCNALIIPFKTSLQWCYNGRDGISNHQPHDCLLNRLFRRRSKKTSKLHVTGLCVGNSPGTGEFPAQMASNAENVSIWWRHHVMILDNVNNHIFPSS